MKLLARRVVVGLGLLIVSLGPFVSTLDGSRLYFYDDLSQFSYPLRQYYADCLKEGRWALWCPYLFAGYPLIADGQIAPFYPVNLALFRLLPTPMAFSWASALGFLTAAWGMYLYVGRLSGSAVGGLMGASALVFSGFWVGHVVHLNLIQTVASVPWAFYCLDRAWQGRWAWLAGLAVAVGLAALGGFPQMVQILLLGLAARAAWNSLFQAGGGTFGRRIAWLVHAAGALLLGLALGAVQLLPTYELLQQGPRAKGLTRDMAAEVHLPPRAALTYLAPRYFGWCPPDRDKGYWGGGGAGQWEFMGYVGAVVLALALASLGPRGRHRHGPFFALVAVASLVASFGPAAGVVVGQALMDRYPAWLTMPPAAPAIIPLEASLFDLIRLVPGFQYFRVFARFTMLSHFALAVLAGLGIARLATDPWRRSLVVVLILVLAGLLAIVAADPFGADRPGGLPRLEVTDPSVLAAVGTLGLVILAVLLWPRGARSGQGLALAVMVAAAAEAAAAYWNFNRSIPTATALAESDTVRWLRKQGLEGRLLVQCFLPQGVEVGRMNRSLGFNVAATYRLAAVSGYAPLQPLRSREVEYGVLRFNSDPVIPLAQRRPLLKLLRVQAVVATPGAAGRPYDLGPPSARFDGTDVYWLGPAGPEALVVGQVDVMPTARAALEFIWNPTIDLSRRACLERPLPEPLTDPSPAGEGRVIDSADAELELDVRADRTALVVISRRWDPGWRAWLNGVRVDVLQADYFLQAVCVPRGRHRLRLAYLPTSLAWGGGLSAAAVAALGVALAVSMWRRGPRGTGRRALG